MKRRSDTRATSIHAGAAVALALGAWLLAGCASPGFGGEPIEVQLVALTPLPSTTFEHRVRVDLRLRNPNNRDYRIEGLRFLLDVNGRRLASGVSDAEATLPRLGEVVVPVVTSTSVFDLVNQVVAIGRMEQPHFEYELRGKLFLAGAWGAIPFTRRGDSDDLLPVRAAPAP